MRVIGATKDPSGAKTKVTLNTDFSLSIWVNSMKEFDRILKSGNDLLVYIWWATG